MYRIGFGTDIHRLAAGLPLVIGGVTIESPVGAEGHSDADVLLHAITDALLGSLALGDIGSHFPDSNAEWKGAASIVFLRRACELVAEQGYAVSNIDSVIDLQTPKLRSYVDPMRENIAAAVGLPVSSVSVKAKTAENLGSVGEGRAIKAQAAVLIQKLP